VLCVGQFVVGLGECVLVVCGRVSCGFGGVTLFCEWDSYVSVYGSEYVLCVE